MSPTCPKCQQIHCARDVVAVERFAPTGALGYRNMRGGQLHSTRDEATADLCDRRAAQLAQPTRATTTATPATAHDERTAP